MPPDIASLSHRFRLFADEVRGSSPLYERLSLSIAGDPELLGLCAAARAGQPLPNLLFAAVHSLLLGGAAHPLARYYPTVMRERAVAPDAADGGNGDPYPLFRTFCLAHRGEIEALLATRLVQTNEVRRSACLLPAFAAAANELPGRGLALVEIGPSAGLNLLWDRYGYEYRQAAPATAGSDDAVEPGPVQDAPGAAAVYRCGDLSSPVQITCNLRGAGVPLLPGRLPQVVHRTGIDLNPIDVRDPGAVGWLRALIWPEHVRRLELLESALQMAAAAPPALLAGDAGDLLPGAIAAAPGDAALCIFHSFVINQFSADARIRLSEILADAALGRDLAVIALGYHVGETDSRLDMALYRDGTAVERTLARCSGHGRWLEWLD